MSSHAMEDFYYSHRKSRIASGIVAKKKENLDFCYLTVKFLDKTKTCGCVIMNHIFVATSARCLVEWVKFTNLSKCADNFFFSCSEKEATNITVHFPQKVGKDATRKVLKFYIPDGVNGEALLEKYDETMDSPSTTMIPNNIGLIKLASSITIDNSRYTFCESKMITSLSLQRLPALLRSFLETPLKFS